MNKEYCFVPRDAGFFSVFNFLVGGLKEGLQLYPLFNKQEIIDRNNGIIQHFCYCTENFNSWFDYFEPVSFYENDLNHISETYLQLKKYSGENSSPEFRIPSKTKELLININTAENKAWRLDTHQIYSSFINFKKDIVHSIENIWNNNFNKTENIIGVHYRHPSHFIESGKIYLEDYFSQIDQLLNKDPSSKIFLASDSQFGIYSFLERYQNKIIYLKDIDRLSMAEFLHWSFSLVDGSPDHVGFVNGKGFELHHKRINSKNNYKITLDLLKEVLLLSKCNQLINNVSNIPFAISYINPEIEIITL